MCDWQAPPPPIFTPLPLHPALVLIQHFSVPDTATPCPPGCATQPRCRLCHARLSHGHRHWRGGARAWTGTRGAGSSSGKENLHIEVDIVEVAGRTVGDDPVSVVGAPLPLVVDKSGDTLHEHTMENHFFLRASSHLGYTDVTECRIVSQSRLGRSDGDAPRARSRSLLEGSKIPLYFPRTRDAAAAEWYHWRTFLNGRGHAQV